MLETFTLKELKLIRDIIGDALVNANVSNINIPANTARDIIQKADLYLGPDRHLTPLEYERRKLIGNRQAQHKFFGKAIDIQKHAYTVNFANAKCEFACEVLLSVGFCQRQCDQCKLNWAHQTAIAELEEGTR